MREDTRKRVERASIDTEGTLTEALKLMDATGARLLFVMKCGRFVSVLSIGDIQRAIVRQTSLDTQVRRILRSNVTVASPEVSLLEVKRRMLAQRTECMPVVDAGGHLVTVHFWDELFQTNALSQQIKAPVVVMAGGRGSRLRPLTNIIPKALIPVGEKPMIEEITDRFASCGCETFYVSLNYKGEMIERYFSERHKPYALHYLTETQPLGTAGALRMLESQLSDSFFVSNCDILVEHDYGEIYREHVEQDHELTAVAAVKVQEVPYGIFECDAHGMLRAVREKPSMPLLVNVGLYVLKPHLIRQIPSDRPYDITELIDKVRQRGGRVGIFPIEEGDWIDIGQWKQYFSAISSHAETRATGIANSVQES